MPILFLFYSTFKGAYAVAARGFGAHPRGISLTETNETEEECVACLPLFLFYLCYYRTTHLFDLTYSVRAGGRSHRHRKKVTEKSQFLLTKKSKYIRKSSSLTKKVARLSDDSDERD